MRVQLSNFEFVREKNKLPKSRRERGVMIAEGKQLWIVVEVDMLQVTKVLENI